jgi:hypothetical protein
MINHDEWLDLDLTGTAELRFTSGFRAWKSVDM